MSSRGGASGGGGGGGRGGKPGAGPLPDYNPLLDKNLRGYFSSAAVQRQLLEQLGDQGRQRSGRIVGFDFCCWDQVAGIG